MLANAAASHYGLFMHTIYVGARTTYWPLGGASHSVKVNQGLSLGNDDECSEELRPAD